MALSTDDTLTQGRRYAASGALLVVLAACGFSAKAVLVKLAYAYSPGLDAVTMMTLRMVVSLPFFLAVAWWSNARGPTRLGPRDTGTLALLGIVGFYLAGLLDFSGLTYISAGLERVILFLYPTIVVLLSALLLRRRLSRGQTAALIASYCGIALVFGATSARAAPHLALGTALVFGAAVTFALYILASGELVRRIGSARFTAYVMTGACVATLAHFAARHSVATLTVLPPRVYGIAVIMALFSTVIPAFLLNAGMRRIGASATSIISSIGPVITLYLAHLLLGETVTSVQLIGTLVVIAGVLLGAGRSG